MTNALNILILLVMAQITNASLGSCDYGYTASFQGVNPIASLKKGFIDFTDPGMSGIATNATFAFWGRWNDYDKAAKRYSFSWMNKLDINYFQPFILDLAYMFGASYDTGYRDFNLWHHYAFTLEENTLTWYVDAEVVLQKVLTGALKSLQGEKTVMHLGAQTYSAIDKEAVSSAPKAMWGEIDEFAVFSRAITQVEVQNMMGCPLDVANLDSSLVLFYNFDDVCTSPSSSLCDSDDVEVMNLGSAGASYNLLSGSVNNDFGFGTIYTDSMDTTECPVKYSFEKPLYLKSTVPVVDVSMASSDFIDTPLVFHIPTEASVYEIMLPANHTVDSCVATTIPDYGIVIRKAGDSVDLLAGNNLSGTNAIDFVSAGWDGSSVEMIITCMFSTGSEVTRYHFHHLDSPSLVTNDHQYSTVEDKPLVMRLGTLGIGVEHLDMRVISSPANGQLRQMSFGINEAPGASILNGSLVSHWGGAIQYTPNANGAGAEYDEMQVQYTDPVSGLFSVPLTVKIAVEPVNDLPESTDGVATTAEDSAGVTIVLSSEDAENVPGIVVSKLPTKGSLFEVLSDGSIGKQMDRAYQIYDVGDVIEQYVASVRNVSSFWGNPPDIGYHAINVVGSPTCLGTAGECSDMRFSHPETEIPIGDLVKVNRYFGIDDAVNSLSVVAQVVNRTGAGRDALYELDILPMQRLVNSMDGSYTCSTASSTCVYTPCVMAFPGAYPADCSAADWTGEPVHLKDVPRDSLSGTEAGVWSPLNKNYVGDTQMVGGQAAAAYGDTFNYVYNQASSYNPQQAPMYTEFIEVTVAESIFAVAVEIGSPRGGGSVVSIKALDSNDEWHSVYDGVPLLKQFSETNGRRLYFQMSEQICRPFFKTNTFRLELDTTGIADWNYIDYIKFLGALDTQTSMLRYPSTKVLYVPDSNAFGEDTFSFKSYDCGGNRLRESNEATVALVVTPLEDPPTISFTPQPLISGGPAVVSASKPGLFEFEITEMDLQDVEATLFQEPSFGSLGNFTFESISQGDILELTKFNDIIHRVALWYQPDPCKTTQIVQDSFIIQVVDSAGSTGQSTVAVHYNCGDLPTVYHLDSPTNLAFVFGYLLGFIGIIFCVIFAMFNIIYRKVPIVRFTTPGINLVIIGGCFLEYLYLATYNNDTNIPSCSLINMNLVNSTSPDLTCSAPENNCCTDLAFRKCIMPTWLVTIGISLTFGALLAKTFRIHKIFNNKKMTVQKIKNRDLYIKNSMVVAFLLAFLVIWQVSSPTKVLFSLGAPRINVKSQLVEQTLLLTCDSANEATFKMMLIFIIGMMLFYGAYLAYAVRNVQLKQINDSKQIALATYNMFIFGALNVALSEIIVDDDESLFIIIAVFTFLCSTMIMASLFVPRMIDIKNKNFDATTSGGSSSVAPGSATMATAATAAN